MTDRYYNRENEPGSELFLAPTLPHLLYNEFNSNHVAIDDGNVFWSPIPAGQQLTYTDSIPDGLEAIPAPVYTAEEQAAIDLRAAGVNGTTITAALYAEARGITTPLATLDAAVDAVVLSSGLTLAQVSELV